MNKHVLLPLAIVSVLVGGLLLRPERAAADPSVSSIHPVMALDADNKPMGDPIGTSQLIREDTGLSYQMTTSRLAPLNTYTVWWVLFTPDNKMLLARYGGGAVALPDGTASFAGRLPVGPLPVVDGKTVLVAPSGASFDDPRRVRQGGIRHPGPRADHPGAAG